MTLQQVDSRTPLRTTFMKEELLQRHSVLQCFTLGLRIYRTNLIPIVLLTLVLLIPSFVMGLLQIEIEHIVFFIMIRLTEAAMALGIITLMFQPIFPIMGILKIGSSRLGLGAIHIAILQFVIFLTGSMFAVFGSPLNMILFFFLMVSIFVFAFSQIIYIAEGERGFRALMASFRLVRSNSSKTIITIVLLGALKLVLFSLFFLTFLPDFEIQSTEQLEDMQQLLAFLQSPQTLQALRWSQYLGFIVLYPFSAIIMVLLYFDLKLTHASLEEKTLFNAVANLLVNDAQESPEDSAENSSDPP